MPTTQAITDWTLPGSNDQPIFGSTHLPPADQPPRGVMILCHGFKGYKDYGFIPPLAQAAADHGLIAHRFNFSHSGVTHDHETFARPDLFEQDTWGKQIHDLHAVGAATAAGRLPGGATDPLPVVWFGHSRGGVTVLLACARLLDYPNAAPLPAGLIAAAAPDTTCSLDPDQARRLRQRGYIESPSSRTGQVLRIGKPWLDEIEQDPEQFDPLIAVGKIERPILLIHGSDDQTVPPRASRRLAAAAKQQDTLTFKQMPSASHTFQSPNPLPLDQTPPPITQQMIDLAIQFTTGLGGEQAQPA